MNKNKTQTSTPTNLGVPRIKQGAVNLKPTQARLAHFFTTATSMLGLMLAAFFANCQTSSGQVREVRQAFINTMNSIDKRDLEKTNKQLHAKYRSGFTFAGTKKINVTPKADYLNLLEQKKIGGVDRQVEILSIYEKDGTAHVRAKLTSGEYVFAGEYLMVDEGQGFQLLQDMAVVSKK